MELMVLYTMQVATEDLNLNSGITETVNRYVTIDI